MVVTGHQIKTIGIVFQNLPVKIGNVESGELGSTVFCIVVLENNTPSQCLWFLPADGQLHSVHSLVISFSCHTDALGKEFNMNLHPGELTTQFSWPTVLS